MVIALSDVVQLLLAVLLAVPIVVLPGYAIAARIDILGYASAGRGGRAAIALLVAYGTIPLLSSLVSRFIGIDAALVICLGLAAFGLLQVRADLSPRMSRGAWIAVGAGLGLLSVLSVDVAWDGNLYGSLIAYDLVKHAATIRALLETGAAPPLDPFFLRAEASSYYYFFYTPSALMERLSIGLIDSRAAFGGQVPWLALALVGLVHLLLTRSGLTKPGGRSPLPLALALMALSGFQIALIGPLLALLGVPWPGQLNWIGDGLVCWIITVLWVPHHVAAVIASWLAFLCLIEADRTAGRARIVHTVVAGLAFAATAGLSTWVAMGTVAIVAVWGAMELLAQRWRLLALMAVAGALSLVVALPHLIDLVANRAPSGSAPIAFKIRVFIFAELINEAVPTLFHDVVRLLLLPLNWLMVGGITFLGSVAYWRKNQRAHPPANPIARVITISAVVSLVIGSFVASTLANNDLGWRVVLFVQLASVLWTTAVLLPLWQRAARAIAAGVMPRLVPTSIAAAALIGAVTSLHEIGFTRAFYLLGDGVSLPRHTRVDYEQRAAYAWLATNAAKNHVVQHNPDTLRATGFGLYGRHRTAIADTHNAILFGPSADAVKQRFGSIAPVFKGTMNARETADVLRSNGVDAIVVSAIDPAWTGRVAWVFATTPLYASTNVRVLDVSRLTDGP